MATQPQPTTKTATVPVTADNFIRAETDVTFAGIGQQGGFGKFHHFRDIVPIENHTVQRGNRVGLNPEKDAIYLNITPTQNNGTTNYTLTVKDVPVDGFWSISLYGADGFFHKNKLDAYTLNSITSKRSEDGSVTIHFGDCDSKIGNCLPIMPGWNYMVRLYRPRKEILDGTWEFPDAKPVP